MEKAVGEIARIQVLLIIFQKNVQPMEIFLTGPTKGPGD